MGASLARPVPNAFFESSLVLLDRVDDAAKAYFRGLFQLTILDAVTLSLGLTFIGLPYAVLLGLVSAVLMWIPYLGGIAAAVCACIVAVTEFPGQPAILYGTLALYLVVRWLDGLVFMPMTIGKNLHIHPVVRLNDPGHGLDRGDSGNDAGASSLRNAESCICSFERDHPRRQAWGAVSA